MRQCEKCGKGSIIRGARKKLRGKYNPTVKKRKYPNLQKSLIGDERLLVCTGCIRTEAKASA